jgi:transcriptional regulator with XRE-family HTH domain
MAKKSYTLREAREAAGMTQTFVSQGLGVSQKTLSYYEAGKREPSNETIQWLADLYERPIRCVVTTCSRKTLVFKPGK